MVGGDAKPSSLEMLFVASTWSTAPFIWVFLSRVVGAGEGADAGLSVHWLTLEASWKGFSNAAERCGERLLQGLIFHLEHIFWIR